MNIIAAVDMDWGIGKDNKLLVHIPEDLKLFKGITENKVVIMGRKTLEGLPGGKPLKNRINIVLSRDPNYIVEDAYVCNSIEDAIKTARAIMCDDNIFIIGGSSLYNEVVSMCKTAYITKINKKYDADKYLINLDDLLDWEMVEISEPMYFKDMEYRFLTYNKNI